MFVHAMRKLPQLRDPRCFAGWLRRIAARMAINRLTRRGPLLRGRGRRCSTGSPAAAGARTSSWRSARRWPGCRARWRELKPLDRQTLEAFYLRGRSLKQMGREFDVPTGTIKRRLHVARQRLRAVMEGEAMAV